MSSAPEPPANGFRLVSGHGASPEQIESVLAKVPAAAVSGSGETEMFPTKRHVGPCRICGTVTELTEEHIPPRGAFNKQRMEAFGLDELLGREDLEPPTNGQVSQGGIRGYVLCEPCNNLTGTRWGREYQEWAYRGAMAIQATGKTPSEIDEFDGYPYQGVGFRNVYPGRFVRQVISHMLSISAGPELGERFPDLRELALGGDPRELPDPLRIYLNLYAHNAARIAGGPTGQGTYSGTEDVWRWLLELSFAPLSTILLIDGPPDPYLGIDITDFTTIDVDAKSDEIRAEDGILIGFGHKPFPGDFRTKGQLLAQRDLAGSDLE